MNVGFDIDGTIDAFPRVFQSLISALATAGHHVFIITGVDADTVTQADIEAKRLYLVSMGIVTYTSLIVCPTPHAENKARVIQEQDIELFIDNDKGNVKAAAKSGAVSLLLWNAKQ